MIDVAVVGGGITGLAAAYRLRQLAPDLKIGLFEATSHLGGKVGTERVDDFVVEWGADCFLSRKPRGVGLCEELGIAEQLVGRDPAHAKTFVLRHGRLHRLPEGLTGLIPTNLEALASSDLLSDAARARLAAEPTIPPRPDDGDETVGHFIARRLGQETLDNLVEPLMGGIYAGQVDQLSLAATFPQLRQLELNHGSLLNGLNNRPAPKGEAKYPPFVSFADGMQTLVNWLIDCLSDVTIWRETAVTELKKCEDGFQLAVSSKQLAVNSVTASAIVLATPAFVNGRLLKTIDPEMANVLDDIPYASTALVNLAFDAGDLPSLDGYGYVIPRVEGREALACTWSSLKWQHRAPSRKVLMRLYIGRYGQEDVTRYDDGRLLQIAQNELRQTLDIDAKPLFDRIVRFPKAMPQYNLGHLDRLAVINGRLAHHDGLYLAGAAFNGVGIPDCVASGEKAAVSVIDYLEGSHEYPNLN